MLLLLLLLLLHPNVEILFGCMYTAGTEQHTAIEMRFHVYWPLEVDQPQDVRSAATAAASAAIPNGGTIFSTTNTPTAVDAAAISPIDTLLASASFSPHLEVC